VLDPFGLSRSRPTFRALSVLTMWTNHCIASHCPPVMCDGFPLGRVRRTDHETKEMMLKLLYDVMERHPDLCFHLQQVRCAVVIDKGKGTTSFSSVCRGVEYAYSEACACRKSCNDSLFKVSLPLLCWITCLTFVRRGISLRSLCCLFLRVAEFLASQGSQVLHTVI